MAKTLPISEIQTRLPERVSGIAEREEEIVVTRNENPPPSWLITTNMSA
jgi:hypothetical protein